MPFRKASLSCTLRCCADQEIDVARRQQPVQDFDRLLDPLRSVEKFDDQRQARQNVKRIRARDLLRLAEARDAAENRDASSRDA